MRARKQTTIDRPLLGCDFLIHEASSTHVERTLVRYFVLTESLGNGLKSVLRKKPQPLRER
jgi:hypothetical protein